MNVASCAGAETNCGEFSTLVAECTSFSNGANVICTSLAKMLADMSMRPATSFDVSQPLSKYGVDFFAAIELCN